MSAYPKRVDLNTMRLLECVGPSTVWALLVAAFLWFGGYKVMESEVVVIKRDIVVHEAKDMLRDERALGIEVKLARMEATLESIDKRLERHDARRVDAHERVARSNQD